MVSSNWWCCLGWGMLERLMKENHWSGSHYKECCSPRSSTTEADVGVIQLISPVRLTQPAASAPQHTLLGNRCSQGKETGTETHTAWFAGHFLERHYLWRTYQTPCLGSYWILWMLGHRIHFIQKENTRSLKWPIQSLLLIPLQEVWSSRELSI